MTSETKELVGCLEMRGCGWKTWGARKGDKVGLIGAGSEPGGHWRLEGYLLFATLRDARSRDVIARRAALTFPLAILNFIP